MAYYNLSSGSYSLQVENNKGCVYDSTLHILNNGDNDSLSISNCFSPNNDNVNDTWFIPSMCGEKISCKILNRWGIEVAHINNDQVWDGRVKDNTEASAGVYYYIAEIEYVSGVKKKISGFISLLR